MEIGSTNFSELSKVETDEELEMELPREDSKKETNLSVPFSLVSGVEPEVDAEARIGLGFGLYLLEYTYSGLGVFGDFSPDVSPKDSYRSVGG